MEPIGLSNICYTISVVSLSIGIFRSIIKEKGGSIVMELTKKDRLILYNQYEILKLLNSNDEHTVKQYEVTQEILANGYKNNYNDLIEWMADDITEKVSKFVLDVLQLYRTLDTSYNALPEREKEQINVKDIRYAGFDGNEECDYYAYANFILKIKGWYEEIYNNGKYIENSHYNVVPRYTKMLETWEHIHESGYPDLSLEQIKEIIAR